MVRRDLPISHCNKAQAVTAKVISFRFQSVPIETH